MIGQAMRTAISLGFHTDMPAHQHSDEVLERCRVYSKEGRTGVNFLNSIRTALRALVVINDERTSSYPLELSGTSDSGISRLSAHLHLFYHHVLKCIILNTRPLLFSFLQKRMDAIRPIRIPSSGGVRSLLRHQAAMPFKWTINIVSVHAEGEIGDVIVGGVLDPVHCKTMYEQLCYFRDHAEGTRLLLMQEPRDKPAQCMNMILAPCNPEADAAFLTLESAEYPPMSGANTICTATVLLDTGMLEMKKPVTKLTLEVAAGLIDIIAGCENSKVKNVAFDNVPAFVYALEHKVNVSCLGVVSVDIAWGGMHYVLVDAASVGLAIKHNHGQELVRIGELIKAAVIESFEPVHPENHEIRGVTILEWTEPLQVEGDGTNTAKNTVVVSPGRFDRSPCGTGTSARMAVLHARGELRQGETFKHRSIIGTEFVCQIRGTAKRITILSSLPFQTEILRPIHLQSQWRLTD
ncbi:hypothetical protein E8E11_007017 [Didymella keratinophila]|nr:hypothetical protein E8E11_007017 [Didymella keratinophila]